MAGSPDGLLSPPMLFPHNALASGPQARLRAEKEFIKMKVNKFFPILDFPGQNC
jgi:hypothetical protein